MRWDPIISSDNPNIIVPLIYVKPDKKFLEIIKKNFNIVSCKISGTNMAYDAHNHPSDPMIAGIVSKSSNTPNYRPNFFDATGYYVITLVSNWYGYPENNFLGTVEIYDHNPEIKPQDESEESNDLNENSSSQDALQPTAQSAMGTNNVKLSNPLIISGIVVGIILLILGVATFFKKRRNNK
jgi:hypothetical protein